MGGRGVSSSSESKTINGRPVLDTARGYEIWNIGRNAPKGYVPLIKGTGENAKTAYIKSQYADEFSKNTMTGRVGVNSADRVLVSQINRTSTRIQQLKSGKVTPKGESVENAIKRNERLLEAQKLVRKLRLDIYNR